MLIQGRYELFDAIGEGGMATVHLARMHGAAGFARVVAVKRLRPELARDPDFVAMLVDEARLASRIRHPNVVQVIDVIVSEGELLLVLEYVSGIALSRLLTELRVGPVPPAIAAGLFVGMLNGLHAAHEARGESGQPLDIVHRDVSPQNILVGSDGLAHLLDFGIAKAIGRSQVTRDGALKGKVAYMAPEQLRRGVATRAVDVYSAAVSLWETLTGQRLFDAEKQSQLVVQVLSTPVRAPSALAPDIPAALDAIVMRGLDRERTRRFPTAAAMALAIESAVAPASANAIADWLAANALGALEERSRIVAVVEGAPPVEGVVAEENAPLDVPPEESTPAPPTRRRTKSIAALGLALLLASIVALLAHRSSRAPLDITPPIANAPTDGVEAIGSVPSIDSAAPDPASAAPSPDESRSARARGGRSTTPARSVGGGAKTIKPASDACDPPYTLAGDRKVWKRNCL